MERYEEVWRGVQSHHVVLYCRGRCRRMTRVGQFRRYEVQYGQREGEYGQREGEYGQREGEYGQREGEYGRGIGKVEVGRNEEYKYAIRRLPVRHSPPTLPTAAAVTVAVAVAEHRSL